MQSTEQGSEKDDDSIKGLSLYVGRISLENTSFVRQLYYKAIYILKDQRSGGVLEVADSDDLG